MFKYLLILALFPLPLWAEPPSLAALNQLYDGLVREEQSVLDQQARVRRNVENPDLILMVESGGQIIGMTRDELRGYFSGLLARAQTLGITEAFMNRLPYWQRTLAEFALASGAGAEAAVETLAQRSIVLRALEREKLPLIEEDLAQIRARAAGIQRQREDLRAAIARGDSSSLDTSLSLDTCRDPNIPADFDVSEATIGYGGSGGYKAKGNYICIWADGFLYREGNVFARYHCNRQTGQDCVRDDANSRAWTAFNDPNPAVLFAYHSGSSSLRFYAPTP